MPLWVPLILGGLTVYSLYQTGKSTVRAIENWNTANRLKEEAERKLKESKKKLNSAIIAYKNLMENIACLRDRLSNLVRERAVSESSIAKATGIYLESLEKELARLGKDEKERKEYIRALSAGGKLILSGGASAFVASTVPILVRKSLEEIAKEIGVSSTGKLISQLSGVAQKNAIYAWLGGGAKSAGGLGAAGGMMLSKTVSAASTAFLIASILEVLSKLKLEDARDYASRLEIQAMENSLKAKLISLETRTKEVHYRHIRELALRARNVKELLVLLASLDFLLTDRKLYIEEKYYEILQRVESKMPELMGRVL